ncbi:MAG: hypothetical protein JJE04_26030 [Acidobacteriia bacterium]|nr:hypothetical protein [Terriglobia bacterium]
MSLSTQALFAGFLLSHQNKDGGWGFAPGRASWLEPTYYAMLALDGVPAHAKALDRAWNRIRSWQLPGGGCRPTDAVDQPGWTTALWIQLHCRRKVFDGKFHDALFWLTQARGDEGKLWRRLLHPFLKPEEGYLPERYGWSWFPETNSWVEPTVHSLLAMQSSLSHAEPLPRLMANTLKERVALGQHMLLDRRCDDGGWNYGSKTALRVPLPSYPETTAIALLGLQQASASDRQAACSKASQFHQQAESPLARAWLQLALRVHGETIAPAPDPTPAEGHPLLASLQMLGAQDGNFHLMRIDSRNS